MWKLHFWHGRKKEVFNAFRRKKYQEKNIVQDISLQVILGCGKNAKKAFNRSQETVLSALKVTKKKN